MFVHLLTKERRNVETVFDGNSGAASCGRPQARHHPREDDVSDYQNSFMKMMDEWPDRNHRGMNKLLSCGAMIYNDFHIFV